MRNRLFAAFFAAAGVVSSPSLAAQGDILNCHSDLNLLGETSIHITVKQGPNKNHNITVDVMGEGFRQIIESEATCDIQRDQSGELVVAECNLVDDSFAAYKIEKLAGKHITSMRYHDGTVRQQENYLICSLSP